MTRHHLERLIRVVEERSTNCVSYWHGPRHWRCVALVGIRLARVTDGADALTAFLFGLFHDAMRENDHDDAGHGSRGAALFDTLCEQGLVSVSPQRKRDIGFACRTHTEAEPTDAAAIGVCYDGDRLNLWRFALAPSAKYLSTTAGITMARTAATQDLHDSPLEWSDVLDELYNSPQV